MGHSDRIHMHQYYIAGSLVTNLKCRPYCIMNYPHVCSIRMELYISPSCRFGVVSLLTTFGPLYAHQWHRCPRFSSLPAAATCRGNPCLSNVDLGPPHAEEAEACDLSPLEEAFDVESRSVLVERCGRHKSET